MGCGDQMYEEKPTGTVMLVLQRLDSTPKLFRKLNKHGIRQQALHGYIICPIITATCEMICCEGEGMSPQTSIRICAGTLSSTCNNL